jgi:hypothetical protein
MTRPPGYMAAAQQKQRDKRAAEGMVNLRVWVPVALLPACKAAVADVINRFAAQGEDE